MNIRIQKCLSSGIEILLVAGIILFTESCDTWPPDPIESVPIPDTSILNGFPVIDVHLHIYGASDFYTGAAYDHITWPPSITPKDQYESVVQQMKDNHVVLAIPGGLLSTTDYYYMNYPENRSMFLYSVQFKRDDGGTLQSNTLSALREAIEEQKIRSIGELVGIYAGIHLDDPGHMQVYALADSFSLPVYVHTGIVPKEIIKYYPNYAEEGSNPCNLKPILEKYPDVNFNAAHVGQSDDRKYDFEDDVIEMMDTYDNFYVDISAVIWWAIPGERKAESFIRRAIKEGVEHKLLFGSDVMAWPDAITASVNYIKRVDYMTDTVKKQILYWNAAKYLKLSDEEIAAHFGK